MVTEVIIPALLNWIVNGSIALVGSTAHYFYILEKNKEPFNFAGWYPNILLSLFIGNLIASINIPGEYLTAAILIAGFSVYEIFDALESKLPAYIGSTLDRFLGPPKGGDK